MTVTPLLRLNLPAYDQTGWDDDVNNNFSSIDALVGRLNTIAGYAGVWTNSTAYTAGQTVTDSTDSTLWQAAFDNTSAATGTFPADRTARPTLWTNVTAATSSAAASAAAASASAALANTSALTAAARAASATTSATLSAASATASAASALSASQVGNTRNKLRNPLFTVAQRGAGPFTASGVYSLDGWSISYVNGSTSVTQATSSDADRAAVADEEMTTHLVNVYTGAAAAGDFNVLIQRIEDVRRLAGKTVTLSLWAKVSAGTANLGLDLAQNFGTSGGPSAQVSSIGSQKFSLTTTWTRFTSTPISIPSVAGKTLGSDSNDFLAVDLWNSSGATNLARSGVVGVQSKTVSIWGVQLEIGSVATALEKREYHYEQAFNQRYAQLVGIWMQSPAAAAMGTFISFQTVMRATPSATNLTAGSLTNIAINSETANSLGVIFQATATLAAGNVTGRVNIYSAEL